MYLGKSHPSGARHPRASAFAALVGVPVAATGVAFLLLGQGCFGLVSDFSPMEGGADTEAPGRDATPDSQDAAPDTQDASPDSGDGSFEAGDGDANACPPAAVASDFYVDPGGGVGCNTFPTIAAALSAANASAAASPTIHLAEGTYDASHGESFPIELRGVSIVGAGGGTVISGVGQGGLTGVVSPEGDAFYPTLSTVSTVAATFVVGDANRTSRIANLSISAPIGLGAAGIEGIVCDRGNARNPPAPQPAANTQIDGVTLQGFEVGVRVTWSSLSSGSGSATSGCNARITSSTLSTGDFGVFADGTLFAPTSAAPQYVSMLVGDVGKGKGNAFVDFTYSSQSLYLVLNGAAVEMADAVAAAILSNQFARSDCGIVARQTTYGPGLDIESNDVGPLTNGGIVLTGSVAVATLANNTVHDVTMRTDCCGWLGVGLQVNESWGTWPFIARARGNSFLSNDVGVAVRTASSLVAAGPDTPLPTDPAHRIDFGTASSPGGNRFRCNSATPALLTATGGRAGTDVEVDVEVDQAPNVVLSFEGNVWDHAPPTAATDGARVGNLPAGVDGVDVHEYGNDAGPLGATIDVADASTSAYDCPDGRVP
jgi:hypothetical protein